MSRPPPGGGSAAVRFSLGKSDGVGKPRPHVVHTHLGFKVLPSLEHRVQYLVESVPEKKRLYEVKTTLKGVLRHPERYVIVHYSSQSLFDEVEDAFSPRITSIVAMFYATRQTVCFSMHSIAEELGVDRLKVAESYDEIERALLSRFFKFAQDNFDKCWLHWNMRNTVFGFEHLEHRYRVLFKNDPPIVPFESRVNVSDVLKHKYGPDFAPDPRMLKLMELNGRKDPRFLSGADEASAFKRQEFIRMNSSTISKVEFFRYVLDLASKGKLKTGSSSLPVKLDRALDSPTSRITALVSSVVGIPSGIAWIISYFF